MRVDKKFIYVFYFFVVVQGMACPCCKDMLKRVKDVFLGSSKTQNNSALNIGSPFQFSFEEEVEEEEEEYSENKAEENEKNKKSQEANKENLKKLLNEFFLKNITNKIENKKYIPLKEGTISFLREKIASLTPIYYGENDNYIRFYKKSEKEINGLNDFLVQISKTENEQKRQDFYDNQKRNNNSDKNNPVTFLDPVGKDELLKMCEDFNSFYFDGYTKIERYLTLSRVSFSSGGYIKIEDDGGGKRFFLQKFWDMFEDVVWNKITDKDNIGIVPLPGKKHFNRELIIKTLSSFILYLDIAMMNYFCPNFGWPIFYYRILADLTEDNYEKVKLEDYMSFGEFIDLLTRFNPYKEKNPFDGILTENVLNKNRDIKMTEVPNDIIKACCLVANKEYSEYANKEYSEYINVGSDSKTSCIQKCFSTFMGDDLVGDLWIFKKFLNTDTFSSGKSIEDMRERCEGGILSFENLKLALCSRNPKGAKGYEADNEALEATKKMLNIVEKYIEGKFKTENFRKKKKLEFLTSFCNFVLGMKALQPIYVLARNNNSICVQASTCFFTLYVDKNALLKFFNEVVEGGKKQSPRYPRLGSESSHDKYNDSDINKMAWAMFAFLYLERNVKTGMVEN